MNWEITAGQPDLNWKSNKHWWVMTWRIDYKGDKVSEHSPIHVFWMDGDILMLPFAPRHAYRFGSGEKELAGPAGDRIFYLNPKDVWARMPLEIPETPNVKLYFNN